MEPPWFQNFRRKNFSLCRINRRLVLKTNLLVVFKTNSIFYTYEKMSLSDSHKHVLEVPRPI